MVLFLPSLEEQPRIIIDRSEKMAGRKPGLIALFDVDGTLTAPRKAITLKMVEFMKELRKVVMVGVVGGSDLVKISEQLGKSVVNDYDYVFSENGLVAYRSGELIDKQEMEDKGKFEVKNGRVRGMGRRKGVIKDEGEEVDEMA
ncbi:hypothetical protein HPP92_000687 [Vanilla planifolia]|uniref:Phosphomannomutase n=1 Tax=Vanilla planifolia TaxID=51239 RepID=A0A835RXY2_VANPL|nr:hypothetical protein HPP92_000687 [Vanilla planifolia]